MNRIFHLVFNMYIQHGRVSWGKLSFMIEHKCPIYFLTLPTPYLSSGIFLFKTTDLKVCIKTVFSLNSKQLYSFNFSPFFLCFSGFIVTICILCNLREKAYRPCVLRILHVHSQTPSSVSLSDTMPCSQCQSPLSTDLCTNSLLTVCSHISYQPDPSQAPEILVLTQTLLQLPLFNFTLQYVLYKIPAQPCILPLL